MEVMGGIVSRGLTEAAREAVAPIMVKLVRTPQLMTAGMVERQVSEDRLVGVLGSTVRPPLQRPAPWGLVVAVPPGQTPFRRERMEVQAGRSSTGRMEQAVAVGAVVQMQVSLR